MENKLFRDNSFKIVGKLTNADLTIGNRKSDGAQFASVKATITSSFNGKVNEYEVSFYANEKTAQGADNKLFATYSALPELVGKKVEISGSISESRFWSSKTEQMASAQVLNGRWVKGVTESSVDEANYVLGGFVANEVTQKTTKDGAVYRYDLTIAQSNYNGDNLSMFTVHVDPEDREILAGVQGYHAGDTVQVQGDLSFVVEEKVVEDKNVGFGKPVLKKFTNITKTFRITGGSNPIHDETSYDNAIIRTLIDAYKASDVERMTEAKNTASAPASRPVNNPAPVTQRQTSLI